MLLCTAHIYVYRDRTCHHSVACIGGNSIAVADIIILTDYIELRAVGDNIGIYRNCTYLSHSAACGIRTFGRCIGCSLAGYHILIVNRSAVP